MRAWWSGVMRLHGKSGVKSEGKLEVGDVIANGFRFYARLYRILAALLMVASAFQLFIGGPDGMLAGPAALAGAALYLLVIAPLANRGADQWKADRRHAQIELVVFFAAIAMFLTGFISSAAVVGICYGELPGLATVLVCGALIIFGVGSYALEIVYVVNEGTPS
jgi:hypothetical protein